MANLASPPRRLAVYGYVDEQAGSLCSGHFLALRELLQRGTQIDFYAIEGWVTPGRLAAFPNLHYRPLRRELCRSLYRTIDRLPFARVRSATRSLFAQAAKHLDWEPIGDAIRQAHAEDPYDALLVLGLLSPWQVRGLATVSWTQGPPNSESGWYRRNIWACARSMGPAFLPILVGGYLYKHVESSLQCPHSDVIIAGSTWSLGQWQRYGVKPDRLAVLPYPIDLKSFRPAAPPADKPRGEFQFLHVGRIVPRKRVDLLLDALPRVLASEPGVRLLLVGRCTVPGVLARLRAAGPESRVEYHQAVEHEQIAHLLARANCIVQPSEHENFGSAVAEALACGRPVLVGPTNGTKDFAHDAAVVFDAYTPEAVARGMIEMVRRCRVEGAELAAAGRRAAERSFDPAVVTDRLCDVLAHAPTVAARRLGGRSIATSRVLQCLPQCAS